MIVELTRSKGDEPRASCGAGVIVMQLVTLCIAIVLVLLMVTCQMGVNTVYVNYSPAARATSRAQAAAARNREASPSG